jgi:hypothetical protein
MRPWKVIRGRQQPGQEVVRAAEDRHLLGGHGASIEHPAPFCQVSLIIISSSESVIDC